MIWQIFGTLTEIQVTKLKEAFKENFQSSLRTFQADFEFLIHSFQMTTEIQAITYFVTSTISILIFPFKTVSVNRHNIASSLRQLHFMTLKVKQTLSKSPSQCP